MPYHSTRDLPPAVRRKLSPKKQRQWMHVWNSSYNRHNDESRAFGEAWSTVQKAASKTQIEASYRHQSVLGDSRCGDCSMFLSPNSCSLVEGEISPSGWCRYFERKVLALSDSFRFYMPLSKVEDNRDGTVTVTGYASTPAKDLDNEIVALDAVRKALPSYMEWRNIREMHQPSAVGRAQEANVDDRGLFLRAKVSDPTAAQKCRDKVYNGFSIGGRKLNKVGDTITDIELVEISIVDRPANPECRFEVAKRAKGAPIAHLLKVASNRSPEAKAVANMAKAVRQLSKAGPPAAHDGFSLPAKIPEKCSAHGVVDCKECMDKREFSPKERQQLASTGEAMPGGGFPIKDKQDLDNARQAVGRAKNPAATRAHIRSRARALGVKLPDNWKKKWARKFLDSLEKRLSKLDLEKSAQPSFLTLGAAGESRLSESRIGFGHGLDPGLELDGPVDGASPKPRKAAKFTALSKKERKSMKTQATTEDDLSEILLKAMGRKTMMPMKMSGKMKRFQMARTNMKKARMARKECSAAIEAAHKVLKAAYLAKAADLAKKGKPPMDDDDDDDIGKAMRSLNKAYSSLNAMKTFMKAVSVNMEKAAGRVGQRGQEASDADPGYYEVPMGVKDISPSDMATASPGGDGRGSEPPLVYLDEVYPGKAAKKYSKYVSPEVAELMTKLAASEARAEILEKLPAGPVHGKKPYAFDVSKLGLGDGGDSSSMFKDVSPVALVSDNEEVRKEAVGKVIGNMILQGHGKSVFDPNFHGTAGSN